MRTPSSERAGTIRGALARGQPAARAIASSAALFYAAGMLVAGNWKMNGTLAEAERIARGLLAGRAGCEIAVFPPATALAAVARVLAGSPIGVGGQDCHPEPAGQHTGDVSAEMLRDAGATWVILGHSERRAAGGHGETDQLVRAKVRAARRAGLQPIVCVGETEGQRAAGHAVSVVRAQLHGSLPEGFAGCVAYEPVWAIGSGRVPSRGDVAEMHAAIREVVGAGVRILYGGSVKPENARSLLGVAEVDGALVGGASLDPAAFLAIADAAVLCKAA